jgi:hypothetical protein
MSHCSFVRRPTNERIVARSCIPTHEFGCFNVVQLKRREVASDAKRGIKFVASTGANPERLKFESLDGRVDRAVMRRGGFVILPRELPAHR